MLGASDPAPDSTWTVTVAATGQRVAAPVRLPGAVDLPDEIEPLVHELATLDPGSVPGYLRLIAGQANADATAAVAARLDWWTLWDDPTAWQTPPAGRFTLLGTPPCPLAVTRPTRAWVAMHADWRITWTPVARGTADFPLGELDFEPPDPWPAPSTGGSATLTGRGILNDGPLRLLLHAHERPPASQVGQAPMLDAAACSLDGFLARVRGEPEGFWFAPNGMEDTPARDVLAAEGYAATPVAAGSWRLVDLRVVDAFGRTLDIIKEGTPAGSLRSAGAITASGAPGCVQRPRYTAPLTVDARFLDPTGATAAPGPGETQLRPVEVTPGQSPLAGWFVPTPIDGSVELFDPGGASLGRLAIDRRTLRTGWEDTPTDGAIAAGVADPLERIANPVLARVARSLIGADRARTPSSRSDSALGGLLRLVDTTLPYVDTTGSTGTGHLSLLLGTPLAMLRVGVTVDVDDPQADRSGALAASLTPVRLGSLTRLTDGVIAFWVEDQADRLYPVHPLIAQQPSALPGEQDAPITHPYLTTEPVIWIRPGTTRTITLLVAPGAQVTVTSGLAPRKALELLPEWTDHPAGLLTPTLAFDTVLRAQDAIALPVADDLNGIWTWYRRAAGTTAWVGEEVPPDPAATTLGDTPSRVEDGYLRVRLLPPPDTTSVQFQVVCIRRNGPVNTIQEISIRNPDGTTTRLSIDEAIRVIEIGRVGFYVNVNGHRARVIVDTTPSGVKYLRTTFDTTTGDGPGNALLDLPNCPTTVPNVVGKKLFKAVEDIRKAYLSVGPETRHLDLAPLDQVIGQYPDAGTTVGQGTILALTVSDGPAATVPNVVGQQLSSATASIYAADLGDCTVREFDPAPLNQVIAQQPDAGTKVGQGTIVTLTVSDGRLVPAVVGQQLSAAKTSIQDAYLSVGTVTRQFDPASFDQVIGQHPDAGTKVSQGTAVTLTVSDGRLVPAVVGQQLSAAKTSIQDAYLSVGTVTRQFDPASFDQVIGQHPDAGTKVSQGTAVTLTVSDGPAATVPAVVGQQLSAAAASIQAAHLSVGTVTRQFDPASFDQVIAQQPKAGTTVRQGAAVTLTVSDGPAATVPAVVGQQLSAAAASIQAAHLSVGTVTRQFDPTPLDQVIAQQPKAGTTVRQGAAVTLTVSGGPGVLVPNVVGQQLSTATATLRGAGLTVGAITYRHDNRPKDQVLEQMPTVGSRVASGGAVNLTLSDGWIVTTPHRSESQARTPMPEEHGMP